MNLKAEHWAAQNERGHRVFLRLTEWMVRHLPVPVMRVCTACVCLYFYLTAPAQRRHIRQYQTRLQRHFPHVRLPESLPVYRQFAAFGEALTDRFAVWQRRIRYADLVVDDPDNLYADMDNPALRGQILICSHLGNAEICRALADSGHHPNFKLNVLVHSRHAQAFNQALKNAGASELNLIQVAELDAAAMLALAERLDQGEWLAVAADRVPLRGEKTVTVDFLGHPARLPQGAWLLAGLLKARTNTLFVLKQNGRYHLKLRRFADVPAWTRGRREAETAAVAQRYADRLAEHAAQAPLQWFNFYDFWNSDA
ncbi:glycosyl transferase family 2 [Neisseria shayeganii]|uniref:Glycosyl transferase family 2 n=1 Tax=Neisseria shayeganii TaxID=607712 RepID=A0A7D7NCT6_9NEIS|nr:glycosyl transferase family 2 [Neisseria shayeganii]QMT41058.1 glycosyl transferase family 2 [Neisseria shayeganii]